jgi:hypothetical protein
MAIEYIWGNNVFFFFFYPPGNVLFLGIVKKYVEMLMNCIQISCVKILQNL